MILYNLINVLNGYRREFAIEIEKSGLTFPKWIVLKTIKGNDNITAANLAEKISMDKATLSELLNRMSKEELIIKTPSPSDKRCFTLTIGKEALKKCQLAMQIETDFDNMIKSKLSKQEIEVINKLIKK